MKSMVCALLVFGCLGLHAEVDLEGKLPEDFDWMKYVEVGESTIDQRMRALEGVNALVRRMDGLCGEYRKLLESRGGKNAIRVFDEMQAHWKRASDAEVKLIGDSWGEGTGAKVAYPQARLRSYLNRVKELKEIADLCLSLNE